MVNKQFDHLIGKKILYIPSNTIFIPRRINYGMSYILTREYDVIQGCGGDGFVFDDDFDHYFKILKPKITNWKKEMEKLK